MPRINKKRPTSSKKKKKKSNHSSSNSKNNKNATAEAPPLDLNQILSQADVAYETSNTQNALQLYAYAQTILQQQIRNIQQTTSNNKNDNNNDDIVSKIMTCAKVSCKIGEIKVSFHDPNDSGCNDFMNGIQLLSQENEQKYITTNQRQQQQKSSEKNNVMIAAQWKEARANLFLYLGQLSCEKDALNSFTNAIHDLKACISILEQNAATSSTNNSNLMNSPTSSMVTDSTSNDDDDETRHDIQSILFETRKSLCGACCSVAELYLTDLCFELNAEQECEQSLTLALELDQIIKKQQEQKQQNIATNTATTTSITKTSSTGSYVPDAVQAMANLRLCQNRPLEAIPYIVDAYDRMKVGCEALSNLVGLKQKQKGDENETQKAAVGGGEGQEELAAELKGEALDAANSLPGFEFRCQTAKILLECAANLEQHIQTASTEMNNNVANKIENIHG